MTRFVMILAPLPLSNMGATYEHTFAHAGTFSYYCSVHFFLGMTGTVTVQ